VEHTIKLTTDEPIRRKPYPVPFSMIDEVNTDITKMIDMGILESSESPYAFPLVIIKRPGKSNRMCVDFRHLNRITVFDAEPMPNAEEMFTKIADSQYFTKIELSKGYWQVPLSESEESNWIISV